MAISITHPFISLKGDGGDATLVRPSNWNANHTTSMATLKLLGRLTAGVGAFEELTTTALVIAALNSATGIDFLNNLGVGGFKTGDVKFSIDPTAETGWLAYNGEGTIGKAGSGATILASATAQTLYELIYNNITDAFCPVSGGRSGNATNDFNAGKTIGMPRFSGRTIIGAGTGSGLTARADGAYGGAETHALSTAELAAHSHSNSLTGGVHTHTTVLHASSGGASIFAAGFSGSIGFGGGGFALVDLSGITTGSASITLSNASAGSGNAHNNMQPFIPLWAKVKL